MTWTAEDYLAHSAKGTSWQKKDHKYVKKEGNRYFYDIDNKATESDSIDVNDIEIKPIEVNTIDTKKIHVNKLYEEENPLKKMFDESDQQYRTNNFFENLTQSVKDALSAPIEAIGTAIKIKKGIDVVRGVWNGLYNTLPSFHTMVTRNVFK